jgi:hypothetical protein
MLITDATAAAKALRGVYPAILIETEDDEIETISLVDTPAEFLVKGAGGAQVICKVFERGASKVKPVPVYSKKWLKLKRKEAAALAMKMAAKGISVDEPLRKAGPAIPASAEAALAEWSDARKALVEGPGEPNLKRARLERAQQQVGIEMVKAVRSRAPMSDPRMTLRLR